MNTFRPVEEAAFRSQPVEPSGRITGVRGQIPSNLRGTFLRSGPGLLEVGQDPLNFFDGHALVAGVTFEGGTARWRARFVRSPLFVAETTAGAMKQRRIFTNVPRRWANLFALEFGNSAMHDVYAWGGKVYAGNDLGHFALDARTLETLGEERWGDVVPKGHEMSPMPHRDPETGRLVGWVKHVGKTKPDSLCFVELDERGAAVVKTPFHRLDTSPAIVHEQRASSRWYVATQQAMRLSVPAAMWGVKSVWDCLRVPRGTTATLLLVPRGRDGAMLKIPLPKAVIAFHVINAYDESDERLVVDLVTYDGLINFSAAATKPLRDRVGAAPVHGPQPTPTRLVVDVASGRIVESKTLSTWPGESVAVNPSVLGKRHRFAYMPTTPPGATIADRGAYFLYGGLGKLDVDSGAVTTWLAEGDALVSPPAFVTRPGATAEDDGWLLAYVLREGGAEVVILDALDLAKGPVATLELGTTLPGVSHVRFAPEVMLDP